MSDSLCLGSSTKQLMVLLNFWLGASRAHDQIPDCWAAVPQGTLLALFLPSPSCSCPLRSSQLMWAFTWPYILTKSTYISLTAKKIPYVVSIQRVFISENLISLCSNKPMETVSVGEEESSKQGMASRKHEGFCTCKTSICSFFPKWQVQGSCEAAEVRKPCVIIWWELAGTLQHFLSPSESSQTIGFCFKYRRRNKTKPLHLFKMYLHMSEVFRFQKYRVFQGIDPV